MGAQTARAPWTALVSRSQFASLGAAGAVEGLKSVAFGFTVGRVEDLGLRLWF